LASGWTTWDGMRHFTGEPILAFMITFGIQGVMLIIAWLIGESFATGLIQKNRAGTSAASQKMAAGVGLFIGTLFAVTLSAAFARWLGIIETDHQTATINWVKLADSAIYLGLGLLVISALAFNRNSEITQPYIQSMRVIARSAVLWVMFLACMATSVFFSFDSLFSSIFPGDERKRAADIRAVNQVASVVADTGALVQKRQSEEAEALLRSDGWRRYDENLSRLARESQGAEKLIEDYFVQQMEGRRRSVAEQQERIATSVSGQAGLISKKNSMTDELSRLKAERPELAGTLSKVKSELDERARALDAKRIEAQAEEKGAEGTLKIGRGPQWRERMAEMTRLQEAYKIQEERVRDAQKRLATVDQRLAQIERELAAIDGDIAKLKGEAQTAETRIKAAEQSKTGEEGVRVDPARVRNGFERARAEFLQEPTIERLSALTQQCTSLLTAMTATPATKERVRDVDCDPKPAAEAAGRLFALNTGLETFARNCAGGDKLPQGGGTDVLLTFGRKCLQDSGLPSRDAGTMAAKLSSIDLNRDDKAHRFVVTWNAFQDGNRLAYLALAIAIAIDSLIFMSGLFGANAVRSPLTDLEGRSDLTADQLEAAIDHSLNATAHPRETLLALLRGLHPIHASDGFTSEIILDDRDPLAEEMRTVLVAGATIGAVRRAGHDRTRYLVSTGLARYFAMAQKKNWKVNTSEVSRKQLVNVVGVALLPEPQTNAANVLAELHPISDAPGYAAETYPFRITEEKLRRLMLNVLGAGATVPGAVQRFKGDDDRYFVSTDLYKTLLMMSAGAVPGYANQSRLADARSRDEARPLVTEPAVFAAPAPVQLPPPLPAKPASRGRSDNGAAIGDDGFIDDSPAIRRQPPHARDMASRADARNQGSSEFESSLRNQIRDELIQLGGLFPWDARDVSIAARLGEGSAPEAALRRLQSRAPKLGELVADAISDYRNAVQGAYEDLHARQDHDSLYVQVLETVAGELMQLMPLLLLSPGGPYQAILDQMIRDLEPQSAEGLLSPQDQLILIRARQQVEALKRLSDDDRNRLDYVARIIEQYDERATPA
ncbi:MAG TPA: hypothetical protein VFV47_07385, partial [Hyphomicrobiaceae bacterium]|nr:hypothetical protein [Hyphomicrobiaceae bacterium]